MRRLAATLAILVGMAAVCPGALAAERFPTPEFTSGYELPKTEHPPPRAAALEWLDVGLLVVALGLASYFAFRLRSRRALFALAVASLFYFGFVRGGCICPVGAVQNVVLAIFQPTYAIPLTVLLFFLLPLFFALVFGRVFCSSVCPLGALQDLVLIRPVRVPGWLEEALRLLAYAYLGATVVFAATGAAFLICRYDPFVGFFRLSGSLNMVLFGACVLVIALFVGRPYCRFFCPYGVLLSWLSRVSSRRVTITPDECVRCRLCEDSCPFGALRAPVEPPTRRQRLAGRRRLAYLLALAPVLVGLGAWGGGALGTPFSKLHATVALAERVRLEEEGEVEDTTDASEAFRETGRPPEELYADALALRRQFALGGRLFGAWMGLVVGVKLLALSVWRTRADYEADRALCVACGRCYDYCPVERQRRKALSEAKPL